MSYNGQMSCNGLSITVVNHFDQALWEKSSLSSIMQMDVSG